MDVTLEDAYAEACRALGESVVRERLMAREMQRREGEIDALRTALQEHLGADADDRP